MIILNERELFRTCRTRYERCDELDEEFQYHLDRQVEQNIAKGMDPREARYAATRRLGGIAQRKEECRDLRFQPAGSPHKR